MESDTFSLRPLAGWAEREKSRKLLAGVAIEHYQDSKIPQVINAVNDLDGVKELLTTDFGYAIPEGVILQNAQADRKSIENLFDRLIGESKPRDRVFFFYAGHGWVDPDSGAGYLVPFDAAMRDNNSPEPATCITWDAIRKQCLRLPAEQVFLAVDACFSGSIFDESFPKNDESRKVCQALAASSSVSYALSSVDPQELGLSHSPFTQALMNGLRGFANRSGDDSTISGWELIYHVEEWVREATRNREVPQRPLGNWLQRPGIAVGGASFDFLPLSARLPTSILAGLNSRESTARTAALNDLQSLDVGEELKIRACEQALKDPTPTVRAAAARVLGQLNSAEAMSTALRGVQSNEREKSVRQELIDSIGSIGSKGHATISALDTLRDLLRRDVEYEVRFRAAKALGSINFDKAGDSGDSLKLMSITILEDFLNDGDSDVELWSAWALSMQGNGRGLLRLIEAVNDRDRQTARRRQAAINLGMLGKFADQRVIRALCDAINDPDQKTGYLACEALGGVGDESAIDSLLGVAGSPVPNFARYAVTSIGQISDRLKRRGDAKAVDRIRKKAGEKLLRLFVDYKDTAFRGRCAATLGTLRVKQAVPQFEKVLGEVLDSQPGNPEHHPIHVRAAVVSAYCLVEGPASADLACKFLADENELTRLAVLKAFNILLEDPERGAAMITALKRSGAGRNRIARMVYEESNVEVIDLARRVIQTLAD